MSTRPDPTSWACWRDPRHEVRTHLVYGWPVCAECGASPSYGDRFSYLDPYVELGLYVPNTPRLATITPRSAIVGLPHHDGTHRILVYLEGWINGPAQYGDRDARGLWEAGVEHAAGRMVVRYPTTAMIEVDWFDLTVVGSYWPVQKRIVVTDEGALAAWLEDGQ